MSEVYRAVGTKLGPDVAIKTLPAALASDKDRLARFEREGKLLERLETGSADRLTLIIPVYFGIALTASATP